MTANFQGLEHFKYWRGVFNKKEIDRHARNRLGGTGARPRVLFPSLSARTIDLRPTTVLYLGLILWEPFPATPSPPACFSSGLVFVSRKRLAKAGVLRCRRTFRFCFRQKSKQGSEDLIQSARTCPARLSCLGTILLGDGLNRRGRAVIWISKAC